MLFRSIAIDGTYISVSPIEASTYDVVDLIDLPVPGGNEGRYNAVIGSLFPSPYMVISKNMIAAFTSPNNTAHEPSTLYLQKNEGITWLGTTLNAFPSLFVHGYVDEGGTQYKRVGIGTDAPIKALHVSGDIKVEDGEMRGIIGLNEFSGSSISLSSINDTFITAKSENFDIEFVNHNVMALGILSGLWSSGSRQNFTIKIRIKDSGGSTVAESGETYYQFEQGYNQAAPVVISIESNLSPGSYTAELLFKQGKIEPGYTAAVYLIGLPNTSLGGSYSPPPVEGIGFSAGFYIPPGSDDGTFLEKNILSFGKGGRLVDTPESLYVVDGLKLKDLKARSITASEIHLKSTVLNLLDTVSTYNLKVGEVNAHLLFGAHLDKRSDYHVTHNIQTIPITDTLTLSTPLDIGSETLIVSTNDAMAINQNDVVPGVKLAVNGDVVLTGELFGDYGYITSANLTSNKPATTSYSDLLSLNLELPEDKSWNVLILSTATIEAATSSGIRVSVFTKLKNETSGTDSLITEYEYEPQSDRNTLNTLPNILSEVLEGGNHSIKLQWKKESQSFNCNAAATIQVLAIPVGT